MDGLYERQKRYYHLRMREYDARHEIYTAYFSPDSLLAELGGGELLHAGAWYLLARRRWDERAYSSA